jgi:hypothetical protein
MSGPKYSADLDLCGKKSFDNWLAISSRNIA